MHKEEIGNTLFIAKTILLKNIFIFKEVPPHCFITKLSFDLKLC